MSSRTLYAQHPVTKDIPISPRSLATIFHRQANSALYSVMCCRPIYSGRQVCGRTIRGGYKICICFALHRQYLQIMKVFLYVLRKCTAGVRSMRRTLRSKLFNPALEIVHQQNSVNVYLNIHVERECSAEPFMRSILCHPGSSHLSPVHAYDFLSRCKFSIIYTYMYNGNVQQNPLCAASSVTKGSPHLSPVHAYDFLSRWKFSTLTSTPMYTSRLYVQSPVFKIVHDENEKSVKNSTGSMSIFVQLV